MNVARAFDVLQRYSEACADEREELAFGFVVRSPSLPAARALNMVVVSGPQPTLDAERLRAITEETLRDVPEPQVVVEDDETAARIEPGMVEAGWKHERDVIMTLGASRAADDADTSGVREASDAEILELMEHWFREEEGEQGDAVVRQLVEYAGREMRAFPERRFVLERGGRALGMSALRTLDGVAQVEDVFVLPGTRGGGVGTALVAHAIREARAADPEMTFIVADADDRPRELYARLGFEAQAAFRSFWRPA